MCIINSILSFYKIECRLLKSTDQSLNIDSTTLSLSMPTPP